MIDPTDLTFEYYHSSGPGGQNVNKVATAVRLRFDLHSAVLPEEVKARLARLAGSRLTEDGILIIEARRFRTRERNQQDAFERLEALVRRAETPPRPRRATRPTRASVERRLEGKKRRAEKKQTRRPIRETE